MIVAPDHSPDEGSADHIALPPGRVVLVQDQLTADERGRVDEVVRAFARGAVAGTRLPDDDPFYLLRATPDILIIVRSGPEALVRIEEIVRQQTWQALAHAR